MSINQIELNSKLNTEPLPLAPKEKRALYMSQIRGAIDSEYRRIERENNARAMRKRRSENPSYREQERRHNREHMAEIRRHNAEYREREHLKNRLRMASKRHLKSQQTNATAPNDTMMKSIYETLENNLQSSHISFIPYEINMNSNPQLSDGNKHRNEYEFVQQIYEYYQQQDIRSSSDNTSHMNGSHPCQLK